MCDEDLKSDGLNQQLSQAFKRSIREGVSEDVLKAKLVDVAIKFYVDEKTSAK